MSRKESSWKISSALSIVPTVMLIIIRWVIHLESPSRLSISSDDAWKRCCDTKLGGHKHLIDKEEVTNMVAFIVEDHPSSNEPIIDWFLHFMINDLMMETFTSSSNYSSKISAYHDTISYFYADTQSVSPKILLEFIRTQKTSVCIRDSVYILGILERICQLNFDCHLIWYLWAFFIWRERLNV